MVQELEKIMECVYHIPYDKEKETLKSFEKYLNVIRDTIEKNHFFRSKDYLKDLAVIQKLFDDDLSYSFCGREDKIIHREIQKKIFALSKTILDENKKIFIVHGRNTGMRDKVTSLLGRLKLDYVILENETNGGATIIEKFQKSALECRYAIVLFSFDDVGKLNKTGETLKVRTRQNVILELGYFLGRIGRKNLLILHEVGNNIEKPSDFDGIVYEALDDYGAWKGKVIKELKNAGLYIDGSLAERAN